MEESPKHANKQHNLGLQEELEPYLNPALDHHRVVTTSRFPYHITPPQGGN